MKKRRNIKVQPVKDETEALEYKKAEGGEKG